MSVSKDGHDPKGKSVQTKITSKFPRVLLVDACLNDRFSIAINLRCHNVQVTTVDGPGEALEFLNVEHGVNLILTADSMPGQMSGYDLFMELKKSPKLNHLPVVITSDYIYPERVKKYLDGGAKDYILKPIGFSDIPSILNYI